MLTRANFGGAMECSRLEGVPSFDCVHRGDVVPDCNCAGGVGVGPRVARDDKLGPRPAGVRLFEMPMLYFDMAKEQVVYGLRAASMWISF